jgi:hypothetical protein
MAMTWFAPLALIVLLSTMVGCAPAASGRAVPVTDVKSLSGKWLGWATGTGAGTPNPIDLTINPDGTWTSRTGAQVQNGVVSLNDGKISFTRQGASGGSTTVLQASTAGLQERDGKRVLIGQGRSDYGPYTYEFTEQK